MGVPLGDVAAPTVFVKQTPMIASVAHMSAEKLVSVARVLKKSAHFLQREAEAMEACQGPRVAKLHACGARTQTVYLGDGW